MSLGIQMRDRVVNRLVVEDLLGGTPAEGSQSGMTYSTSAGSGTRSSHGGVTEIYDPTQRLSADSQFAIPGRMGAVNRRTHGYDSSQIPN
jgi:hypothetical protein